MFHRRPSVALGGITTFLLLVSSAGVFAQKKDDKKQDETQKKEVQNLVKLADDALAGQAAPNDLSLAWVREDVLKAQGNKQYIPFIATVDPAKVSGGSLAFYWRVISKNPAATTAATNGTKDDKKDKDKDKDKKGKSDYAYEDVAFIPVTTGQPGPMRIARSFTVPAGSYDVVLV